MSHDHAHEHHDHLREAGRRRLLTVLGVSAVFMVVEAVAGVVSNSLALLADAGHMLGDVAALALTVFALWFARRPATALRTYGYLRLEILAAFVNGVALVVISLLILWHAWQRLHAPVTIETGLMLAVALAGLAVNVLGAVLLHGAAAHSLNIRGAYLHVLGDLLGSLAALSAALIIRTTGWAAADPVASAFVALLILFSSWRLVQESVDVLLESVPRHIDLTAVQEAIAAIPRVDAIHDLHVWTLTSGVLAMSGHIVAEAEAHADVLREIHARMHDRFGIRHVTVQIEPRPMVPLRTRAEAEQWLRERKP
jgi:cobalt-zinc-cadmium efflux system protein